MLPFKLGTAKIINDNWSFVQTIDLLPIINQFESLKYKSQTLTNHLKTNDTFFREYINSLNSIHTLETRIETLFEQILPLHNQKKKRGLFNPLGTFIKCITGNMDQTDAEKIDNQIRNLQKNQNKLKSDSFNQITIMESTVEKFQGLISNLTHNELILKSRILQIEQSIKESKLFDDNLRYYFQTFAIINQFSMMYQSIYDLLYKIENTITFAKLNIVHNSMVEPRPFLKEIQSIEQFLDTNQLPISAKIENILIIEKIVKIKSYLKGTKLHFIIELPLVELDVYQYFSLHPVPVPNGREFVVNIPHKPYLALNNQKYVYLEEKCDEVESKSYLCQNTHVNSMENYPPCEVQLINHHQNITSCHPFSLKLSTPQVSKVIDGKWIATVPKQLVSTTDCNNDKSTIPLRGSFLIEIPIDCKMHIQSIIIETHKPSQLTFTQIALPKLDFTMIANNQSMMTYEPPSLDLDIINIKTTNELKESIQLQKKNLQEVTTSVYVNRVSFWTITLYLLIICVLVYFAYKAIVRKCIKNPESVANQNESENNDIF